MVTKPGRNTWVVLVHQVPREPSTARIAIWRRLKAMGVAQIADGVVALPEDVRTRELLEWVAQRVEEAGGEAMLWRAQTLDPAEQARLVEKLRAARSREYGDLASRARVALDQASTVTENATVRTLRSLRRELRAVQRRDYFPADDREAAVVAVRELADVVSGRVGHGAVEAGRR